MSLAVRPVLCAILAACVAAGAMAQSEGAPEAQTLTWDRAPLAEALYAFTEASGVEIVFALRLVRDVRVSGRYTVGEPPGPALGALLAGSGLRAERVRRAQFVLISDPLNLPGLGDDPSLYTGVLEGRVTDAETDEPLWGAHVWLVDLDLGGVADARGEFAVERLPAGRYSVRVSHVGYRTVRVDLDVFPASPQLPPTIRLRPEAVNSSAATVRPSAQPLEPEPGLAVLTPPGSPEAGRPALSIAGPVLGGDLLGGLSLVPGVSRAGGASGPLTLRGADPGRALVVRDGVPIYGENASFQPEALQSARLHNGPLPVELDGGAGVLELTTRAPGADARGVLAGGLGGVRGVVSAPLAPTLGAQVGWGRPGPSDLPLASGRAEAGALVIDPRGWRGEADAARRAWDAEAKLTWTPRPAQTVEAGVYRSGTRLGADLLSGPDPASWEIRSASTAANVRYDGLVDDRTFASGLAYLTRASGDEETPGLATQTAITEGGLRAEVDHAPSLTHQVRLGAHAAVREVSADQGVRLRQRLTEAAVYARDTWKPSARLELRPGVRLALVGTRAVVEPRLQARWSAVPKRLDLRAGLARQTQAVHRLHGYASGANAPRDLAATRWILASGGVAPAVTWLGGLGAEWRPSDDIAFSADLFVRTARDVRLARGLAVQEPPVEAASLAALFPAHRERAVGLDLAAGVRRRTWALQGGLSLARAEVRREAPEASGAAPPWRASRYSRPVSFSVAGEKTLGLATLGARLDLESARPGARGDRDAPEARLTLGADAQTEAFGVTWILGARAETRLRGEGPLASGGLPPGAPLALGALGPAVVPGVRLVARW